jgi:hypothetical protein
MPVSLSIFFPPCLPHILPFLLIFPWVIWGLGKGEREGGRKGERGGVFSRPHFRICYGVLSEEYTLKSWDDKLKSRNETKTMGERTGGGKMG